MITLQKILLKEIMVTDLFTIEEDDLFSKVWDIFRNNGIRHLPVVDDNMVLKGIVTQRDLYRIMSPKKEIDGALFYSKEAMDRYILRNVMTTDVFTLKPEDPIGKAMDAMVRKKYGCVPVVDGEDKIVGIVTHIDILKAIAKFFI